MKKITIVGGGLSGLTARYYLSKWYPNSEIILFEKSNRLGGCIETVSSPFFFEKGPRTFKTSRSQALLQLIDELGLSSQLIYSDHEAMRRFLWKKGRLRPLSPFSLLFLSLLPSLFKEFFIPPLGEKDETVASFATRRFGKKVAHTLFDPLTLGIFAGDFKKLSISACFPELKGMETKWGSLTRALLKQKKHQGRLPPLFTLKGGLQTLIESLIEKGKGKIYLNTPVTSLEENPMILALPVLATRSLFSKDSDAQQFFNGIETMSLTTVHLAFNSLVIKKKGFGYLVPTSEQDLLLGVVFDSMIFPQHNQNPCETRLTVMMRKGSVETALKGLNQHLNITASPTYTFIKTWKNILPQYTVDHLKRLDLFKNHLKVHYPHIYCLGNFLQGVAVNQCIKNVFDLWEKTPFSYQNLASSSIAFD